MEDAKKRSLAAGPLRLAWPGGGTQSSIGSSATLVFSQTSSDGTRGKRKRQREPKDSSMWVDKYAPTTSAQLCVAPKKVKEVRQWMTDPESSRLLVFVGSPGIGKSTTIRVLASELGWTVHEWSDSSTSQHYTGAGGGILSSVDHTNALESFQDFLDRAGAGFSSLSLGVEDATVSNDARAQSVILIDEVSMVFFETRLVFAIMRYRHSILVCCCIYLVTESSQQ